MTVVVDASALLEYLLGAEPGRIIGMELRKASAHLEAPALCDVEVVSGLCAALRGKDLSTDRAVAALDDYESLPIRLHNHRAMVRRVFELRHNFSPYDAAYVALAERLGARLLTADERLARAVATHTSVPLVVDFKSK